MRHVTLHQLRLFHSLGTHRSYTRVAEELFLTQPAVSIQIKRLEESVGMPLVEQMGKRLFLTEAGCELYDASRDVLERLRVLNEDMIGLESGVKGPINLAAITTAKYFMPHLLGAFLRDYPEVTPRLTITNQARVVERLEANLDDMVVMGTLPEDMELEAELFLDNPIVVVAHPDHPLVGEQNIPLARIAEERFLAREPGSGTRAARTRLFAEHGLDANVYMELGSSEAIKQAVMAGLGISVLSKHNLAVELEAGLISVLDVEHFPLMRQWYAVHLKGKKLSNTARKFRDFLLRDGARIWEKVQPHTHLTPAPSAKAVRPAPRKRST
ncbi:LysR family transcriptional regulator [Parasulfuritortus cantonensis]|uniref:LysR family transcriptional regulator n=1 Tax=Parasulfuritortus cantonensis TaxID=2528202 RepID=A0A4R1B7L8_9PROT|nr:LysR family transcriptional regulator [Parasulfuritortus cantonensis]